MRARRRGRGGEGEAARHGRGRPPIEAIAHHGGDAGGRDRVELLRRERGRVALILEVLFERRDDGGAIAIAEPRLEADPEGLLGSLCLAGAANAREPGESRRQRETWESE